jgi:hypothetical protein
MEMVVSSKLEYFNQTIQLLRRRNINIGENTVKVSTQILAINEERLQVKKMFR